MRRSVRFAETLEQFEGDKGIRYAVPKPSATMMMIRPTFDINMFSLPVVGLGKRYAVCGMR